MIGVSIAAWWDDFAARVLPEDAPEVQRVEMRRAFYAGVASLLITQKKLADLTDDEGAAALDKIEREYTAFFVSGGVS